MVIEPNALYLKNEPYIVMSTHECRLCHQVKPLSEFQKRNGTPLGIRNECKDCISIYKNEYYIKHKEERSKYNKEYKNINKEYFKEYNKIYYENNKDELLSSSKIRAKTHGQKIKNEVLSHYSNNSVPLCKLCGFTDIRALSIDHVDGNGANHRRELKNNKGRHFYKWLQNEKYPEGYQVLCMNCQWIKRVENRELERK